VVVDMPAGSYEDSAAQAVTSAQRIIGETGCQAVKLEGGVDMADQIAAIVAAGIPVMGHIGLLPQSVEKDGGYKIKGRTDEAIAALMADAFAVEKAGAFSVVIEGTIETVAADITRRIAIPTIGIGASVACDGQVLVLEDMLGLSPKPAKFVRRYGNLGPAIEEAVATYAADVRSRAFPAAEHVYGMKTKI
jgi:3-methyl-2-oxobutanoate hydroxymethyltransferase